MKNKVDYTNYNIDELKNMLDKAEIEYHKLLMEKSSGSLKDTSLLPKKRKEIARIKTFIIKLNTK